MNFNEALEALKKGHNVSNDGLVYRMKITSWIKAKANDGDPEWNFFYRAVGSDQWKLSHGFSTDEVLSEEWLVLEEGEDY